MTAAELAGILQTDDATAIKFWKYHKQHREIFDRFSTLAMRCRHRGFRRYGAKTIMENIRYHHDIEKGEKDKFKINNNYTAYYASLFMYYYPEYAGLFEERERKGLHGEKLVREGEKS